MSAIPTAREMAEACGKAELKAGKWHCLCPVHGDKNPSMTIPDRAEWWKGPGGVKCWSQQCPREQIFDEMTSRWGVEFPRKKAKENTYEKGEFGGEWKYWDLVEGKWQVVFRSLRFNMSDGGKNFAQQRWDFDRKEWTKPGANYHRPLYNKRAIVEGLAEKPRIIYVVEGEKCADVLITKGYIGTTQGASDEPWDREAHTVPLLTAQSVAVIADNDNPGMKKALNVCRSLYKDGIKCRLVVLPDLGPIIKSNGKDIFDWFHMEGNTEKKFQEIIAATKFWEPEEGDGFEDLFDTNVVDMAPKQKLPSKSPFAQTTALDYFIKKEGGNIRHCPDRRKPWFKWVGTHWQNVTAGEIKDLVEIAMVEYAGFLARFNPEPVRYARWLDQSQGKRWLMDLVSLAESKVKYDFAQFDANPVHLNCLSGVINLQTKEVLPHARDLNCSKLINLNYDPNRKYDWAVDCPEWWDFQLYVFEAKLEIMQYFQRQAGYFLTGLTSFKMLAFWHGEAGYNGKTVAKELFLKIMGPYARVLDKALITVGGAETKAGNPIQVLGYRLIVIDEVDGADKIDKGVMKKLTGRDSLSGAWLFEETQMFKSGAKPLIIANKLPYMDGTGDPAAWERVQALGYNVTIAKKDRIEDFENILFEKRGEMIFAWMIQGAYDALNGYIDWVTDQQMPRGMNPPHEVTEHTEEWRRSFDSLGEFIEDWCNIGEGYWCHAERLFKHFLAFLKSEGVNQTWTKKRLSRELMAKKVKQESGKVVAFRKKRDEGNRSKTVYLNIEPRYVEGAEP